MLSEISCELFVDNDLKRQPIVLHEGLNLVVGGARAANSIGKTTFLLAIDFCLGGSKYTKAAGDLVKTVGHHSIDFKHEIDDITYFFSRSTREPDVVYKCDSSYNHTGEISLSEYCEWLAAKYGLSELGGTFRDLQSPFFRAFGMNHDDVDRPLMTFSKQPFVKDLKRALELFGEYKAIAEFEEELETVQLEKAAYRSAEQFKIIRPASSAAEYKTNKAKIESLDNQMDEILDDCEDGTLNIDVEKETYAARLRNQIRSLARRRARLADKLNAIEEDSELLDFKSSKDYSNLSKFFPSINLAAIEEIEEFHKGLSTIRKRQKPHVFN